MRAPREEGSWLKVNPEAEAMMGEVRCVGESDDDFPWC